VSSQAILLNLALREDILLGDLPEEKSTIP
jgi:hypothetical protein